MIVYNEAKATSLNQLLWIISTSDLDVEFLFVFTFCIQFQRSRIYCMTQLNWLSAFQIQWAFFYLLFCAIVTVIVAEKKNQQINAMHAIWLDSFNLELWVDSLLLCCINSYTINWMWWCMQMCVCVCEFLQRNANRHQFGFCLYSFGKALNELVMASPNNISSYGKLRVALLLLFFFSSSSIFTLD